MKFSYKRFIDLVLHDSCEELMDDSSVKILPYRVIAGMQTTWVKTDGILSLYRQHSKSNAQMYMCNIYLIPAEAAHPYRRIRQPSSAMS
jgi:hypothetical protein